MLMGFIGRPLLRLLHPWILLVILPLDLFLVMFIVLIIASCIKRSGDLVCLMDMISMCFTTKFILESCLCWTGALDDVKLGLMTSFLSPSCAHSAGRSAFNFYSLTMGNSLRSSLIMTSIVSFDI